MRFHHPSVEGEPLSAIQTRDPDQYGPFFNARISPIRRERLSTAYLVYRGNSEIGLVWSMRQCYGRTKDWYWVAPGHAGSRGPHQTFVGVILTLNNYHLHKQRRAKRHEKDDCDLAEALGGDYGF